MHCRVTTRHATWCAKTRDEYTPALGSHIGLGAVQMCFTEEESCKKSIPPNTQVVCIGKQELEEKVHGCQQGSADLCMDDHYFPSLDACRKAYPDGKPSSSGSSTQG